MDTARPGVQDYLPLIIRRVSRNPDSHYGEGQCVGDLVIPQL